MTQATHTPGPWKAGNVENRTGGRSAVLIWAEGGDDLGEARTFADARLMAAAPDLLAALEDAVEALTEARYYPSELERLRAKIRKAKGEE